MRPAIPAALETWTCRDYRRNWHRDMAHARVARWPKYRAAWLTLAGVWRELLAKRLKDQRHQARKQVTDLPVRGGRVRRRW